MSVLTIQNLTMRFGGITAVSGVNLVVHKGQIFSVIGPNGAGKTTVFNAVTGIYEPTEGEVLFEGQPLIRPFTWKVAVGAALIGLAAAVVVALFAVNVNALWKRAIRDTEAARQDRIIDHMTKARDKVAEEEANLTNEEFDKREEVRKQAAIAANPFSWSDARRGAIEHLESRPTSGVGGLIGGFLIGVAGTLVTWRRTRRAPDVITQGGIARTFQNIRLFQSMTVLETSSSA